MAEGLNSKIQTIKSNARGYRSFEAFRNGILFYCGGLDMESWLFTRICEEPSWDRKKLIEFTMPDAEKIESLEGLRGTAALMIVITHIQQFFFPQYVASVAELLSPLPEIVSFPLRSFFMALVDGNLAVWTFWILSGFVLSYSSFTHIGRDSTFSLRHLAAAALRRYLRLAIPVSLSVAISWLLMIGCMMKNADLAQYYLSVHPTWENYSVWLSSFFNHPPEIIGAIRSALWDTFISYDKSASYNPVLWTMEKEFLGSLALFAWLFVHHKLSLTYRHSILLLALTVTAGFAWVAAFFAGMLLCQVHLAGYLKQPCMRPVQSHLIMAPILVLAWFIAGLPNFLGLTNLLLGMIFVTASLSFAPLRKLLSGRRLTLLGRNSFGIYIGHFPFMASMSAAVYLSLVELLPGSLASILTGILTLSGAYATGYFYYQLGDRTGVWVSRLVAKKLLRTEVSRTTEPA